VILKGSQRGGARQMALHLMNGEQNEHVSVHEISKGFVAGDVLGALNEAYALSKGTKCVQFMYALSLNPPANEKVPVKVFEDALSRIEERLGLTGQPRVLVFHEKEGRRHAHCVWSRINVEEMKAINIAYPKRKLMAIARDLYLEHGWKMPKGFVSSREKNPLNYTRAEWQQALRTKQSPKAIKASLQDCWAISDTKKAFENALKERGYFLAKGDRRGYVAVDVYGEVYSLSRQLGIKAKDLKARLGVAKALPSIKETKARIENQVNGLFKGYMEELRKTQKRELKPVPATKHTMTRAHRTDRAAQKAYQEKRWAEEERRRAERLRKGLKGVWDKLTGKYWKYRKANEHEAWQALMRDRREQEELIERQIDQRQALQRQFDTLREKHEEERKNLLRDLSRIIGMDQEKAGRSHTPDTLSGKFQEAGKYSRADRKSSSGPYNDGPEENIDYEPEI